MEKIAVIGLSCLFPGAQTPLEFWQNLIDRKNTTSLATANQIGVDPSIFFDSEKGKADRYYSLRGGFIHDFAFDPTGYQVPADVLLGLDYIYQWSLYVSRHALQDSGYLNDPATRSRCGVILGNLSSPTRLSQRLFHPIYRQTIESAMRQLLDRPDFQLESLPIPENLSPLNMLTASLPATLAAQALGLGSGGFALDAACASPLYAVQLACEYLQYGKADLMLAGAISCSDPFVTHMGFSLYRAYPTEGVGKPLDAQSGGLNTSEGAGMLALKRYSDAVRDGDRIYATILGVGLSNDGKGKHFLVPSSKGQCLAFERAYAEAAINPKSIDYVECHATGTDLGDKTELSSMDTFYGAYGASPWIGSVKSNLGHLLTAAGMPSVIKVILSMANDVVPPTINVDHPLSSENHVVTADRIVRDQKPWPNASPLKRSAVSAFGFGGTNAHLILEHGTATAPEPTPPRETVPLAIVGMGAHFGDCDSLEALDQTIYQGKQHFKPVPNRRWKGLNEQTDLLQKYGFANGQAPQGAFVEDFELDFFHFKIQPNPIDEPIPQQLLVLKAADEALHDAQMREGGNVAVIIAMETDPSAHQYRARCDTLWQLKASLEQSGLELPPDKLAELETITRESLDYPAQVNRYISYVGNIMASRISTAWDFNGPSFTVSAGENSSFKALEIAQMLLSDGQVDAVVVGAVDVACAEAVLLRQQLAAINTGTPTLSFDQHANGWMIGEGAGAVVLKRFDAAKPPDRIYATVDGLSLIQSSPQSASDAFPQVPQARLVEQACQEAFRQAKVTPGAIGYLEVFGSGVAAQDAAEMQGLLNAYRSVPLGDYPSCALGSVKANIGHTFAASGIASLIKTALCVYHRYIPATPQWTAPKQLEAWAGSAFYVATDSRLWPLLSEQHKRTAAINSLSAIDGSYAHVILSEDPQQVLRPNRALEQGGLHLFPLVAHDRAALLDRIRQLEQTIIDGADLVQTASQTYAEFKQHSPSAYVMVLLGRTNEELLKEIQRAYKGLDKAFAQGKDWQTPLGSYLTTKPQGPKGSIACVYPGAFTAYPGVGQHMFRLFPDLYGDLLDELASNSAQLQSGKQLIYNCNVKLFPRSLTAQTPRQAEEFDAKLTADAVTMLTAGTMMTMMLTTLLRQQFKLKPEAAFGYSLGEFSMMFALEAWKDTGDIAGNVSSSSLFTTRLAGPKNTVRQFWNLPIAPDHDPGDFWGTYALLAPVSRVRDLLLQYQRVYLTHVNTPQESVIAGDKTECQQLIQALNCDYFPIHLSGILHCDPVQLEYDRLKEWSKIPVAKDQLPLKLYSAADYAQTQRLDEETISSRIAQALCQTCDFPRLIEQVYADGARIFLELGPGGSCTRWVKETLRDREHVAIASLVRGTDDYTGIVRLLAKLVSHQVDLDISSLYAPIVKPPAKGRSLVRTITLGGPRIHDQILTEVNRSNFAGQCLVVKRSNAQPIAQPVPQSIAQPVPQPAPQPAPQPVAVETVTVEVAAVTAELSHRSAAVAAQSSVAAQASVSQASVVAVTAAAIETREVAWLGSQPPTPASNRFSNLEQASGDLHAKTASTTSPADSDRPPAHSLLPDRHDPHSSLPDRMSQHSSSIAHLNIEFLKARQVGLQQMSQVIQQQIAMAQQLQQSGVSNQTDAWTTVQPTTQLAQPIPAQPTVPVLFDEAQILEMACGKLANVFGSDYAAIDALPRCTRVPMPPYLFISRVLEITGATRGEFKDCSIVSEYDIPADAWYSCGGHIPVSVAAESSHTNIFMMSYLGIDFETQARRRYRALGGEITCMGTPPRLGETLRIKVSLHSFTRMNDAVIFKFTHDVFVGDRQFMRMISGAGFFSDEELTGGQGITRTRLEEKERSLIQKQFFTPLLPRSKTAFSHADIKNIFKGDIAAGFGEQTAADHHFQYTIPESLLMIDQVTEVDPQGGPWGLGLIVGEKTLSADDWYFKCHFKDDFCLPGTLMSEGMGQLMGFYMLYLGLHTQKQNAKFRLIPHLTQHGRYRGQIVPTNGKLTFRVEVTEIGLSPRPYVKAEAIVIFAGKTISLVKNMGLELYNDDDE